MKTRVHGISRTFILIVLIVSSSVIACDKCRKFTNHSLNHVGTVKFSRPMLVVNDSTMYIYNEGSDCKYKVTEDDHVLQRSIYVGEDSLGVLFKLPRNKKYLVSLSCKIKWPNFMSPNCVENHYASYNVELRSAKYLVRLYSHFRRDRCRKMYLHAILNMISKADYKDSLPNDFILNRHIEGEIYIAELKTKPQVITVPDCYWADDDVVKYTPIIIDIPINQIEHVNTGIELGDYKIWYAPTLSSKQLFLHLTKDERLGYYYGYLSDAKK